MCPADIWHSQSMIASLMSFKWKYHPQRCSLNLENKWKSKDQIDDIWCTNSGASLSSHSWPKLKATPFLFSSNALLLPFANSAPLLHMLCYHNTCTTNCTEFTMDFQILYPIKPQKTSSFDHSLSLATLKWCHTCTHCLYLADNSNCHNMWATLLPEKK